MSMSLRGKGLERFRCSALEQDISQAAISLQISQFSKKRFVDKRLEGFAFQNSVRSSSKLNEIRHLGP